MIGFIARRIVALAGVLLCVVTLTFLLIRLAPGGPFDREKEPPAWVKEQQLKKYQLDGTLWQQYSSYLGDVVRGDLRVSLKYRNWTVNELIAQAFPVSATLGITAAVLALLAGVWLGTVAAVRHHQTADRAAMLGALLAISIPSFVLGPLLILIFALKLKWLPVGGWLDVRTLILPTLTLASPYVAYVARLMRGSMLEVLRQDYLRTARAKGLTERRAVYKHAMKVAILPVVSFAGPLAANLMTGSIVVETIFNIPGMGGFFVNSVLNRDGFLLCGVVIVYCALLVVINLAVDLTYGFLDKRIKLHG